MTTRRLVDPLIALAVGLAAFALYLRTLAPGLLWGDSAEFQFAAWLGGFAHPTGYPLYLMLGWLWTHLLPLGDLAWRMNLFSALWGGVAVGLVYLAALRVMQQADSAPRVMADGNVILSGLTTQITWWRVSSEASPQHGRDPSLDVRRKVFHVINPLRVTGAEVGAESYSVFWVNRLLAAAAALVFAVTPTFWSQAVVAEVYTLNAAFVAAILLAALAWADETGRRSLLRVHWSYLYLLAGLVGLSLAHHRTTLLLLPGLAVLLFVWNRGFSRLDDRGEKPAKASIPTPQRSVVKRNDAAVGRLLLAAALLLAPLLLYAYIPLVAPRAPYFTVPLGPGQTLTLYEPTLAGFLAHISGSVFGAALGAARGPWLADLVARLAGELTWPAVALGIVGIAWLAWRDRRLLALTGLIFAAFVGFNALYGIGDIHVFYIPVYLVWVLWVAAGARALGQGLDIWTRAFRRFAPPRTQPAEASSPGGQGAIFRAASHVADGATTQENGRTPQLAAGLHAGASPDVRIFRAALAIMPLLLLALAAWLLNANFTRVDRSADRTARTAWEGVLAQAIPQDAILITNDRDEMVPQWYLRYVEGQRPDLTGLFPLIQPGPEWSDVVAVTEQALASGRPVYLIKPMPGLEIKFDLASVPGGASDGIGALVRVTGLPAQGQLAQASGAVFGEQLRLAAYEAHPPIVSAGQTVEVVLEWTPLQSLEHDYTTFVHLVNAAGAVVGQSDHRPGGVYYPTSLWRVGDRLYDAHQIVIAADPGPGPYALEVGLYRLAPDLQHLGSPQRVGKINVCG